MTDKKRSAPAPQFGISLLLVVLIVLCMITFAALSLSSALRDYRYSEKMAARTTDYYDADAKAGQKLVDIDQTLRLAIANGADLKTALSYVAGVSYDTDTRTISYQVAINETQALDVELILENNPADSTSLYSITKWKEVNLTDWSGDTTLPVLRTE